VIAAGAGNGTTRRTVCTPRSNDAVTGFGTLTIAKRLPPELAQPRDPGGEKAVNRHLSQGDASPIGSRRKIAHGAVRSHSPDLNATIDDESDHWL